MPSRRDILRGLAAVGACGAFPAAAATATGKRQFVFAAGGDLLGPNEAADFASPVFQPVADIIRSADAAFANAEGAVFDLEGFKGYAAAENGGGYPRHSLKQFRSFRELGLDLISCANNHATDWGEAGMMATDASLDALGLTHAGTGASLAAARAPGLFKSAKGRVSLIATASTFTGMSPAGDPTRGGGPRPGLNPLHVDPITLVSRTEMESLITMANRIGWMGYDLPKPGAREVWIADKRYRVADVPGMTYDISVKDREALVSSVASARSQADFVAFSIHAHETRSGGYEDPAPADFLPPLFHDAIDAGADVVIRHGPHEVQGIEIYKGKPIFYSMGSLFFGLNRKLTIASEGPESGRLTIELPAGWFESAIAVSRFESGRVREVRVYPLVMIEAPGPTRGLPRLAQGAEADRILGRIAERSRAFGTDMQFANGIGVIRA